MPEATAQEALTKPDPRNATLATMMLGGLGLAIVGQVLTRWGPHYIINRVVILFGVALFFISIASTGRKRFLDAWWEYFETAAKWLGVRSQLRAFPPPWSVHLLYSRSTGRYTGCLTLRRLSSARWHLTCGFEKFTSSWKQQTDYRSLPCLTHTSSSATGYDMVLPLKLGQNPPIVDARGLISFVPEQLDMLETVVQSYPNGTTHVETDEEVQIRSYAHTPGPQEPDGLRPFGHCADRLMR
jgi:hypothetical protein